MLYLPRLERLRLEYPRMKAEPMRSCSAQLYGTGGHAAARGRREKEDFVELSKLVDGSGDACGWRILQHSCCLYVLEMVWKVLILDVSVRQP